MKSTLLSSMFMMIILSIPLISQNNCLDFSQGAELVDIPNTDALSPNTNQLTIEMWVYLDVLPSQVGGFVSLYDSPTDAYILYLDGIENELRFKVTDNNGSAERPGIASDDLIQNTWLHIAGVYDGVKGEASIYLNGELMETHTNPGLMDPVLTGQQPSLGGQLFNGQHTLNFNGKMDEIRVWSRALCVEEIKYQMNCELMGNETGLISYYNFNQGTANSNNAGITTLTDVAGGSDGTLSGFVLNGNSSNWVTGASTISGTCSAYSSPVFSVTGNDMVIADGDTSPSEDDYTDFGSVTSRAFYINNGGAATMMINGISLSGPDANQFSTPSFTSVNGNDRRAFTVSFNPIDMGTKTATIEIDYSICGTNYVHDFSIQKFSNTRTWDKGAGTNNWSDAANWHPDGVPNNYETAKIGTGDIVHIAANSYNISHLELGNNSGLVNGGALNFDNVESNAIRVISGNFTNNGTVNILNATRGISIDGNGVFDNNGQLQIDDSMNEAMFISGTFNNNLNAVVNANGGGRVIYIQGNLLNYAAINLTESTDGAMFITGKLTNQSTGTIDMANCDSRGIYTFSSGDIDNYGILKFTGKSGVNQSGIFLFNGEFNNFLGAQITVKDVEDRGIMLFAGGVTFINEGNIEIENCNQGIFGDGDFTNRGMVEIANKVGSSESWFYKDFTNENGATILFKNIDAIPVYFTSTDNKVNNGLLRIENCKGGITTQRNFTNNGRIEIDGTTGNKGLSVERTFDNYGIIAMTNTTNDGILLSSNAVLNNRQNAQISIHNSMNHGIFINSSNSQLNNYGDLSITNVTNQGIYLWQGSLTNYPTGILTIDNTGNQGISSASNAFLNEGQLTILNTTEEAIDGTNFTMTGDLRGTGEFDLQNALSGNIFPGASPGRMTFLADQTFSGNLKMEIAGTTPETEYDQIVVNGVATLTGATIDVSLLNGYVPPIGQTTNFTLFTATSIVGTPTINLPPNTAQTSWSSSVNAGSIVVTSGAVLPVELIDFTARLTANNQVQLAWRTASETNNEGFYIEHSSDGRIWEVLDFQRGAGTTSLPQQYQLTHQSPMAGANYYRLQQTDFDGTYVFSEVLSVSIESDNSSSVAIYPNPFRSEFHIENFTGDFEIINDLGQSVYANSIVSATQIVDLSGLKTGIYFIRFFHENQDISMARIIKN